jgi:excisionase family DNA binding protein
MTDGSWRLDDLLDAPEVAEILHVSPKTVNRLIAYGRGELPAIKVGQRWKVRRVDLKEYLQKRSGANRNQALELSVAVQNDPGKDDMHNLDLQKKRLEVAKRRKSGSVLRKLISGSPKASRNSDAVF